MNGEAGRAVARPVLTSIAAVLFVADVGASSAFFTGKLGFGVDFVYGEPAFYGQVSRDEARIALRHVDEAVFVADVREREDLISAAITVARGDEIERLFVEYQAAGVRFHQVLKSEVWGARTFVVVDLDGNLILFAGPAE